MSFFSDALGHSALLGISLGYLLGLNPSFVLLPFVVILALLVSYLLERTRLWTDALLNIISSSAMAIAIITLSFVGQYKGGLDNLLFGDILAIQTMDLVFSGILLSVSMLYIGLTLRTQMLLTVDESLAIARGVPVSTHHRIFIVLLSLVVGISIKGIGVLLVSAFVVIPACAAQQLSRTFTHYVLLSLGLGVLSAVCGWCFQPGLICHRDPVLWQHNWSSSSRQWCYRVFMHCPTQSTSLSLTIDKQSSESTYNEFILHSIRQRLI